MRTSDPGMVAIHQALDAYALITSPENATTGGRTEWIGEYLTASGYTIRPRRRRLRQLVPRGSDVRHALTYAAAVASMAAAISCGWVQLWAPAAGLIVCAAFFATQAHHQHLTRTRAAAAELAARPTREAR